MMRNLLTYVTLVLFLWFLLMSCGCDSTFVYTQPTRPIYIRSYPIQPRYIIHPVRPPCRRPRRIRHPRIIYRNPNGFHHEGGAFVRNDIIFLHPNGNGVRK
jgi:hypothetical protein